MPPRTMKLPCKLTDEDRVVWASNIAQAILEKRGLEARKKEQARKLKVRIDAKQGEIDLLQEEITDGSYLSEVEVREEQDGNTINTIRADDGSIVAKRSLTLSEQADSEESKDPEPDKPLDQSRGKTGQRKKKAAKKTGKRGKKEPEPEPPESDEDPWEKINRAAELTDEV